MRYRNLALLVAFSSASLGAATPAEIEKKIDALLARMTLEEKLGQMSQGAFPEGLPEKAREEIRKGRWGSFFNGGTPQQKAEAQRIALKESRLGIPILYGQDVIHGFHTVFPIPLGQAASWDPELVRRAARVAAQEASAVGIHWTFAPMMDIAHDPRWGRIAESLGEDPLLTGVLAAAMVRGFQGDSLNAPDSIAACAKHYVGYGAAEAGRDYNTTWIPLTLLRDVYLEPFRRAREAGVATFMSSFNALNGVPASGNEFTLRRILRDEWKFDGFVVSDYTSIAELIPHGYASDDADAALKGIRAGVDMEMVSTAYYDRVKSLIEAKRLDPKLLDEAVRGILRVKFRLGLFDGRVQPVTPAPAEPSAEAVEVGRRLGAESLVLLKNSGVLPLSKTTSKLAVIGPLADSPKDQLGTWAMESNAGAVRTPLWAIRQALGENRVAWAPGLKNSRDESHDGFAAAVDAARQSDAVVLFLGEEESLSGEAASRTHLDLPGAQETLVSEVAHAGKPMIAVILAGRPLTFHNVAERVNAVLYAWHPGFLGGPAISDVLFGDVAPSGKLPLTFPRNIGQVPIYYNHLNTGRPPAESGAQAENKYTSKYIDVSFTPEYPFGFGLSYSRFEYSNLRLSRTQAKAGETITVRADVTNAGKFEADEVAQLYTHQVTASIVQPVRVLRAFRRIHVKPGETQTVEFALKVDELAFHDGEGRLRLEPGAFEVWVAPDSASGVRGEFQVQR